MEEGIWLSSLAFLALGPAERRRWLELDGKEAERRSWFLRQMAAKDAIRLYLHQRQGVRTYPADIELVGAAPELCKDRRGKSPPGRLFRDAPVGVDGEGGLRQTRGGAGARILG